MRPKSVNRKIREGLKLNNDDKGLNSFIAKTGLLFCGCWKKARKAVENIGLTETELCFDELPTSFNGKKVLFISDLHFPGFDGFTDKLDDMLRSLSFDYCFLGGDYSNGTGAFPELVEPCLERLIKSIKRKTRNIYGILGNHDVYETAVFLESQGVKMLLNDNDVIRCGSDIISIVGVDDNHNYRDTNWELAEEKLDKDTFKILLSHSPDNYKTASDKNYQIMLAGHTHGGQICIPPGIPVVTHTKARGRFVRGYWEYKQLKGYTSCGAGTSPIGARIFCQS